MTICQAVAKRINQLLMEKKMTQYRLEQDSGIQHGTMNGIMSARNKGIELNTVMMIARGFKMTVCRSVSTGAVFFIRQTENAAVKRISLLCLFAR